MSITIKEQLLEKIKSTDNENLLQLLNTDFDFFSKNSDITDGLDEDEINELRQIVNEPDDKDTISLEEYKEITATWRKK